MRRTVGRGRASVNPARITLMSCLLTIDGILASPQLRSLQNYTQLAVIGGGPAGLRAAEVAATAGLQVTLFDAKASVGRKFLVAGKGGLNLTHGEAHARFITRYIGPDQPPDVWENLIAGFDPAALRTWAADLGIETFQATSGRVYPTALKAAPLLRRWIERLRSLGVRFEMNHRLISLAPNPHHQLGFSNGNSATAEAVIFALGGGSWPQTGSDGGWISLFETLGISQTPLSPANCGWEHPWSAETLAAAEGQPLKNLQITAGDQTVSGELILTRYGLEGGAIYQLGATLREMAHPAVTLDFKPTFSHAQLLKKMESVRRDFLTQATFRWKLSPPATAILARKSYQDIDSLVRETKHCLIPLTQPRPIAEAISSAGGVRWSELDFSLMLKKIPGVFLAGEMIDWEAPTGGYLMQGCFATASRAANAAVAWLQSDRNS
jgi:uncharacterized flavoprotein (TIGR03862 family)